MSFQTGVKEAKILEDDKVEIGNENSETSHEKNKADEKLKKKVPKIIISKESEPISAFDKSDDKIYVTKSDLKQALNEFRDKVGTKEIYDIPWDDGNGGHDIFNKVVPDQSGI